MVFKVLQQNGGIDKFYLFYSKSAIFLVGDRIALENQHGFGKLSKKFRRISMQPVIDYSILLIKKDMFAGKFKRSLYTIPEIAGNWLSPLI